MDDEIASKLRPLLISYEDKTDEEKKAYKHRLLRQRPETLIADKKEKKNKEMITNLLLYTDYTEDWHQVLCTHYTNITRKNIDKGRQIKINDSGVTLTVNVYDSGIIMFQGTEARLCSVPDDLEALIALRVEYTKAKVTRGRTQTDREEEERRNEVRELQQENDTRSDLDAAGDQTNSQSEQLQNQESPQFEEDRLPLAQPSNLQPGSSSLQSESTRATKPPARATKSAKRATK